MGVPRGLGRVLLPVLAGHGAVLALLASQPGPAAPRGEQGAQVPVLQIRPVQPPAPPAPEPAVQASTLATPAGTGRPPPPQPPTATTDPASEPVAVVDPWAGYVPRGELTRAPRPLTTIPLPFPPEVEGLVDLRVRVTLFIDETGRVQRVRLDTPGVPPAFARTIIETFGQARFAPGEQGSVAVRSQLRLEVEFEANPRARS